MIRLSKFNPLLIFLSGILAFFTPTTFASYRNTGKIPKVPVAQKTKKVASQNADHLFARQLDQQLNGKKIHSKVGKSTVPFPSSGTLSKNTHYLKATPQKGDSCSHHALINAWAIQELIAKKIPLTDQAIAKKATEVSHLIPEKPEMLEIRDIITRINNDILDVRSLFFLRYDQATDSVSQAGENEREKYSFDQCIHAIRTQPQAHGFFICHVGCHWFLIAVVKQNNQTPQLFILDSLNVPLDSSRSALIQYIEQQIA